MQITLNATWKLAFPLQIKAGIATIYVVVVNAHNNRLNLEYEKWRNIRIDFENEFKFSIRFWMMNENHFLIIVETFQCRKMLSFYDEFTA